MIAGKPPGSRNGLGKKVSSGPAVVFEEGPEPNNRAIELHGGPGQRLGHGTFGGLAISGPFRRFL